MLFLDNFSFPDSDMESGFFIDLKRTCYDTGYPFQVLSRRGLRRMDFEPVTVLYGGNGSGKTTALNVIAEKLGLRRESPYNSSCFFGDYTALCRAETASPLPRDSQIITGDDVFDYMLNLRALNEGIDNKREDLFDEYLDNKYAGFRMRSLNDYDMLKKVNTARKVTQSEYVRRNLMHNARTCSNGESAFLYFTGKLRPGALYLLDEPENSLSARRQIELAGFLSDLARYDGCQFVISTHSPFLLAMSGAKIYDMDDAPVSVRPWTELENVRVFYDFFKAHTEELEGC